MHFVITQVHPFDDGNGRLARLFLSAELVSAGESKIIFPNVKRDDYINGLRLAYRDEVFRTMLKVMTQLYRYTAEMPWRDYDELITTLQAQQAFDSPDEGLIRFSRALRA
jgi:Fic family protein